MSRDDAEDRAGPDGDVNAEPETEPARLAVSSLKVVLPNGKVLFDDFTMHVRPGEVAVLLGGSGAGKSTFARVLFEPHTLAEDGFEVVADNLHFDRGHLGLVPQRGALFDHLDVHGNLDIALRYSDSTEGSRPPAEWLESVGLDARLGTPGTPVTSLSGGQAQRVAVARVLAGRRKLLFLDEPSVGLDPHRVRMLARLIREQVETLGLAAIVVTHDIALAAGVADRLYFLDGASRKLGLMFEDEWPGPLEAEGVSEETRGQWLVKLESKLVDNIEAGDEAKAKAKAEEPSARPGSLIDDVGKLSRPLFRPFWVAAKSMRLLPKQLLERTSDFFTVSRRVITQTLLRPLVFYAIVSTLIGYTVLYVISKVGGSGVRADALIRAIGGSHIIALAPALTAILFVSASGSATNAWLGSMGLTKQSLAMEALGVDSRAYLWSPTWLTLGLSFMAVASLFALGMIVGGLLVCAQYDINNGWALLTGDIFDPRPERVRYTVRAAVLVWIYAWGIASDIVAKGGAPKGEADDVTKGMTSSVVSCTLWMVTWELVTVVVVFNL